MFPKAQNGPNEVVEVVVAHEPYLDGLLDDIMGGQFSVSSELPRVFRDVGATFARIALALSKCQHFIRFLLTLLTEEQRQQIPAYFAEGYNIPTADANRNEAVVLFLEFYDSLDRRGGAGCVNNLRGAEHNGGMTLDYGCKRTWPYQGTPVPTGAKGT